MSWFRRKARAARDRRKWANFPPSKDWYRLDLDPACVPPGHFVMPTYVTSLDDAFECARGTARMSRGLIKPSDTTITCPDGLRVKLDPK